MIRLATLKDALELADLERASFGTDAWSERQVLGTLNQPGGFALLDTDEGAAIGHVLGWATAGEGELLRIGLAPPFRRTGRGVMLLRAFQEECRRRGATQVFLEVRQDNLGAHRLYRSQSWQEAGRRPKYYADGMDALVFTTAP